MFRASQAAMNCPALWTMPIIGRSGEGANPTPGSTWTCVASETRGPEMCGSKDLSPLARAVYAGPAPGAELEGPHLSGAPGGPPQGSGVELTGRPGLQERHACGEPSRDGGKSFPMGRERRPFRTGHGTWYLCHRHGPHAREGGSLLPVIFKYFVRATHELC